MSELIQICLGIVERGLLFSIVTAAVFISSRLITFDNLAIEGAFGLGGAMCAVLIAHNVSPVLSLLIAILIGALSGMATGLLNTKLKLNNLICGIVITSGLFSIMLKIAGSNMALQRGTAIFGGHISFLGSFETVFIIGMLCLIVYALITWFLKTEVGWLIKAVGDTPQMLTNIGKSIDFYIIFALSISNALAALAGALYVQYTGYYSIWTSVGTLIIGLASLLLAQTIYSTFGAALIFGSISYQAIIALTFELQVDQDWNKLISALLIVLLILAQRLMQKKGKSAC